MPKIIDTTLREGEQTPGVRFSLQEKKNIIDGLESIGIQEIELGIASHLVDCPPRLIAYTKTKYPQTVCSIWARCNQADITFASSLKPDILSLSIPVSDLLITDKLEKDREWVVQRLKESIALTRRLGMKAAIGFEDATRADRGYLLKLADIAQESGALRIRLADTIGTASPLEISDLVRSIDSRLTSCSVAIHTHNDLGMATANAITALGSGAEYADATMLGLGERCGCARLEEVAGFLNVRTDASYDLHKVKNLSRYLARLTDRHISSSRPFLGEDIFTCETGLHLHALQKNLKTYEPYPPETIGMSHSLVVGNKAGKKAICNHLNTLDIQPADLNRRQLRSLRLHLQNGNLEKDSLAKILNH